MKKIMLIDGNSIINRAFYGVPLLTDKEGRYTNGVYGFLNILFKLIDEEVPDYLAIAFDVKAPTFRHLKYSEYKGTRKGMPEELRMQMPILKEVLSVMKIKQYSVEGYEADDILGTLSKLALDNGILPVVISGDRDLLQLADENLKVRIPKTKGGKTKTEDYYAKDVIEKYGVTPLEFIEVKALMGDASDNIPGVPSIGEKTATKIIQEYKNIENAIAHASEIKPKKASENMEIYKEQARLSKFLATIIRDMPIELDVKEAGILQMFSSEAYELIKHLEFKSMFNRFLNAEKQDKKQDEKQDEKTCKKIDTKADCEEFFDTLPKGVDITYFLFEENNELKAISLYGESIGRVLIEASIILLDIEILTFGKAFFQDEGFLKIAHDAKKDIKLLRKYDMESSPVIFDMTLAGYVLNPTRSSYAYDDIASEFLNETYPSIEEVLGKGKSKKSIFELEAQTRLDFLASQAEILFRCKIVMQEKIEENKQEFLYREIELPLLYVLADMENFGIAIDKLSLMEYQSRLEVSINAITSEIYELAGCEFNLNSPKQLGVILFEQLGLKGGKKTKTGYSTGVEVLEKLKDEHDIIEKILSYRQLAKLKSTYADGLLAVMDEKTEKIYSTFNQTITATGRISSTEPNLQNIPIRLELGRELRKVFVPTNDSYVFLDADYSQIELRVLAHISEDKTLIDAFWGNQDIHKITASQVFNVPFDEVTSTQRSNAKAVNFGIVYGIGAFSLSQDLNVTRKEAQRYMDEYFAKYPNIKIYMDETIKNGTKNGYVSTIWGRRRAMPELNSNNFIQRSFGERVAMNMPIQGSAADIIKMAMVKVYTALKDKGLRSRLILQVHDELLIETHKEEIEEVSIILKENMEHCVELLIPLKVDVYMGNSWFEAK